MKVSDIESIWIKKHNTHYFNYITNWKEPRYDLKAFFLNSYHLFKTLQEGWGDYLIGYSNLFRRDPANDFYKYRDPLEEEKSRQNTFEWVSMFEIFREVGFPHNDSATAHFMKYSRKFLKNAKLSPSSKGMDFLLCSAVAHLPYIYTEYLAWIPLQIKHYMTGTVTPHQLMMYHKALEKCANQNDLKSQITQRLTDWIEHPSGTPERQILIWARLITRMQGVAELGKGAIKSMVHNGFRRSLSEVYSLGESNWSYSPMILEASYLIADGETRNQIEEVLSSMLAPSNAGGLMEFFDFLNSEDEALDIKQEASQLKEKCKGAISRDECKACMDTKRGDCWIRVLSKLTGTEPALHSGYEVADKVVYKLQQGIYIVVKAQEIQKQAGEGDVLYRQCVSLFTIDHALVLYLNPFDTAPVVIEGIKQIAATSKAKPRFEIIEGKFVRQLYKKYLSLEKTKKIA